MKIITAFLFIFFTVSASFAQKTDEVLATANGQNYTAKTISPETQKLIEKMPAEIAEARSVLLSQMVANTLFETEAKSRGITAEQLQQEAYAKIPASSEAQIKAIYDANAEAFAGKTIEQAKPQIVAFLRREPEQKALQELVDTLKTKHKITFGKDINAPDLKSIEVIATVGGKTISAQDFEEKNKLALYETTAGIFDDIKANIEQTIFNDLVTAEATSLKIESSDLFAKEITNKLREFSDEERYQLINDFKNRLFTKYNVKITIKEPAPIVQNISVDDDPSKGTANAPVTVVMFSDYQCPACSRTHPVLQKVLAEYKDKVRFVLRDYPLINIHENAFQSAIAANAALKQGKFFEYGEVLYKNQDNLDKESLKKYAAQIGLNLKQFEIDLNDEKNAEEVRKDMKDGENYGIKGTPTVFINGIKIRDMSEAGFREAIEKALKK